MTKPLEHVEYLSKEIGARPAGTEEEQNAALYIDPAQSTDLTPAARKALSIPEDRTMESLQKELQAAAEQQQQQAQ